MTPAAWTPAPPAASLWAATARPAPDCPPLGRDVQADVVVVGAGYTGLSAALHLAEAGIAPVVERSGQKSWTHWRYSCPKFLRQTFVEWAGQSVRFSYWANAFYRAQIEKGKPHNTAIRALAFKWIRIAYQCWKTKTPYDESRYLSSLKLRGSPLLS